jgi:flagellar protein FliO/FliZ
MRTIFFLSALLAIYTPAIANEQPVTTSTGGGFQVLMILILVLGLMVAAAWLLKRFNTAGTNASGAIKIVGGIAVGSRERIMVVEVADQWIVVGVTASNINALATMPKQEETLQDHEPAVSNNFASRLKQFIEKRNGK